MNHKGLVTFDRKLKKDSFYLYKAWWSDEPFVHICGKRYVDRPEKSTSVKVYSNQHKVSLYADGKLVAEKTGDKVFEFNVELNSENMTKLEAKSGKLSDTAQIRHVNSPNPSYKIGKAKQKNNWV
jgi:beta-galactosidase